VSDGYQNRLQININVSDLYVVELFLKGILTAGKIWILYYEFESASRHGIHTPTPKSPPNKKINTQPSTSK
jgi:hypothetical protein